MTRNAGAAALVFGAYVTMAGIGLRMDPPLDLATVVWAPTGVALAAVLLLGYGIWPVIALAAFLANVWIHPGAAVAIAVGNTLEALVGGYLIQRWGTFRPTLERSRDVASLVIRGAGLSPLIAASFGTAAALLTDVIPPPGPAAFWFWWWAGNALGSLLVAPLVLVWANRPTVPPPHAVPGAGAMTVVSALLLVADAWFGNLLQRGTAGFAALPLLVWLAVRFGQRAAVTGLAVTAVAVLLYTATGPTPVGAVSLHSLQAMLGVCAVTTLVLAASVTERRRQARELHLTAVMLREETRLLDEAERIAQLGSWAWKVDEDSFLWSAGMVRLHRHTPADMPDSYAALRAEVHPDDRARFDAHVQRTLRTGEPFDFRYRHCRAASAERILHARGRAKRDAGGQIVMLVGTCQDVTYPQRLESALITRNQELLQISERDEAILAALTEGLMLCGPDDVVLRANEQAEIILQRPSGGLIGRRCRDLLGLEAGGERDLDRPLQLHRRVGRPLALRLNIMPLGAQGTVVTFRDITRETEVSRLKSEFVGLASHELRTPLTILQGSLQLLQQADALGLAPDKRQECVSRAFAQSVRLTRIVDDLLRVSLIEQGALPLRARRIDLVGLLRDVVRDWQPIASRHHLTLSFPEADRDLPAVKADPDHVVQILTNLLDNAIKYSPAGGEVTLRIAALPGFLRVVVSDQGIGIANDDLPRIFDRFLRLTTPTMYRERGTGLGLYITRQLVELQGGGILACSQLGAGSSFAFTLPIDQSREAAQAPPAAA